MSLAPLGIPALPEDRQDLPATLGRLAPSARRVLQDLLVIQGLLALARHRRDRPAEPVLPVRLGRLGRVLRVRLDLSAALVRLVLPARTALQAPPGLAAA